MIVPLTGTHQTICQLSDTDSRLNTVLHPLNIIARFWVLQARGRQDKLLERQRLLDEIGRSEHHIHKQRNPPAAFGTCFWMLGHPEYQRWYSEPGSSLVWLSADPGVGKSVMVSYLIDHHTRYAIRDGVNICYWFFRSDSYEQASALAAVRGMLHQVLESCQSAIRAVSEYLEGKDLFDLKTVWTAFIIAVERGATEMAPSGYTSDTSGHHGPRNITLCLIDGLEECQLDSQNELILLISSYFSCKSPGTASGSFKMLIASRPENWISAAFNNLQSPGSQRKGPVGAFKRVGIIRLASESDSEGFRSDLELFTKLSMQDLIQQSMRQRGQGLSRRVLQEIEGKLLTRTDRSFLWMALVIQLLRENLRVATSRPWMDEVLDSRTTEPVMTEVLRSTVSAADAPRARKLFSCMLAATRPLSIQELSVVMALTPDEDCLSVSLGPFRPGPRTCDDIERGLVYPPEAHIQSIGGPLIRIIHDKVYFVHGIVREFLLGDEDEVLITRAPVAHDEVYDEDTSISISVWHHSISINLCHAMLLDICVAYLYSVGKLGIRSALDFSGDVSEFLAYASKSWFLHFQEVADQIQPWNVPYYQNLCHPAFPGFAIWTSKCWDGEQNPLFGFSADEEQDYYVEYFGVTVGEKDRKRANHLIGRYEDEGPLSYQRSDARHSFLSFASNPTVLSSHSFPVRVDENGFVSLDLRQPHGR